jgi:hypothetical protein
MLTEEFGKDKSLGIAALRYQGSPRRVAAGSSVESEGRNEKGEIREDGGSATV